MATKIDQEDSICVLCCKDVFIYAIGSCDHPICYECSSRMRVVCKQQDCAICRTLLPQVIFTKELKPHEEVHPPLDKPNEYGIIFMSQEIESKFKELLRQRCTLCRINFKDFLNLCDHMEDRHNLIVCVICRQHLKVFDFERKFYTYYNLKKHMRDGDPDDKSHRGHPLCEYCVERYYDSDDLFRHMRRSHEYCELCSADGHHMFFPSHRELCNHFSNDHYVCTEGECRHNHIAAVFKTEIELKVHIASVHGQELSKASARHARTLDLEFKLTPRPRQNQRNNNASVVQSDNMYEHTMQAPAGYDNALDPGNFPSLGGASAPPVTLRNIKPRQNVYTNLARTIENFPALSSEPVPVVPLSSSINFNASLQQTSITRNQTNGPTSSNIASTLRSSVHNSYSGTSGNVKPSTSRAEQFPSLGDVQNDTRPIQWIKTKPKPPPQRVPSPPPTVRLPTANDFPSLVSRKTNYRNSVDEMSIRNQKINDKEQCKGSFNEKKQINEQNSWVEAKSVRAESSKPYKNNQPGNNFKLDKNVSKQNGTNEVKTYKVNEKSDTRMNKKVNVNNKKEPERNSTQKIKTEPEKPEKVKRETKTSKIEKSKNETVSNKKEKRKDEVKTTNFNEKTNKTDEVKNKNDAPKKDNKANKNGKNNNKNEPNLKNDKNDGKIEKYLKNENNNLSKKKTKNNDENKNSKTDEEVTKNGETKSKKKNKSKKLQQNETDKKTEESQKNTNESSSVRPPPGFTVSPPPGFRQLAPPPGFERVVNDLVNFPFLVSGNVTRSC